MTGQRLGSMTPESTKVAIEAVLTDLFVLSGYDPQLTDQVDDLAKDLRNSFRHLTVEEIRLAGKAGIAGELGDIRKPSYASIMRWVDAYARSAQLADTRKIMANRPKERPQITDEQGLEMMRRMMPECARRRYDAIRTDGAFGKAEIPHVSGQVFDWFRDEGLLTISQEEWREAVGIARREGNARSAWDLSKLEGGENLLRSRAKHVALQTWMRKRIAAGLPATMPNQVQRIYK